MNEITRIVTGAPFSVRNLSVLNYVNGGFTLWYYRHNGRADDLLSPGFMREADGLLAIGDMVMVSGGPTADLYVVTGEGTLGRLGAPPAVEG